MNICMTGFFSARRSRMAQIGLGCLVFLLLISSLSYDLRLANYFVPVDNRVAMQWVSKNPPPDAVFIVLTARNDPFSNLSVEWFSVFAKRTSINTIQGREWLLGNDFVAFYTSFENLQNCLDAGPDCLDSWASISKPEFNFVYLEKSKQIPNVLLNQLHQDSRYMLSFENGSAVIFERK
jgi:hypothetical protein